MLPTHWHDPRIAGIGRQWVRWACVRQRREVVAAQHGALTWRAVICCRAFWHLAKQGSFMMIMMMGICLSISARGPCFSSPARMPSECM